MLRVSVIQPLLPQVEVLVVEHWQEYDSAMEDWVK